MTFEAFVGQLQHRLETPGTAETLPENEENWGKLFAVVDSGGWSEPSASAR